jgi:hypothetical protein
MLETTKGGYPRPEKAYEYPFVVPSQSELSALYSASWLRNFE